MASIFSKIIAGEIPCYKVGEDENNFAFLDINPVQPGHTLVIPKKEVDYIFNLPEADYISLELFARRVAGAMKKALPCARIAEAVIGMEVPHAHIHLVPINSEADFKIHRHLQLEPEQMAELAQKIAAQL